MIRQLTVAISSEIHIVPMYTHKSIHQDISEMMLVCLASLHHLRVSTHMYWCHVYKLDQLAYMQ